MSLLRICPQVMWRIAGFSLWSLVLVWVLIPVLWMMLVLELVWSLVLVLWLLMLVLELAWSLMLVL